MTDDILADNNSQGKEAMNDKNHPKMHQNRRKSLVGDNLFAEMDLETSLDIYKLQVDVLWSEESPLLTDAYRTCILQHELINSKLPIRILDIGCGTGEVLTRLVGQNGLFQQMATCRCQPFQIDGVELDESIYEICKQRFNNLRHTTTIPLMIHHASATKLPFESNTFDLVLNRHMLHCVPTKEMANLLNETYRVVKPNGIVHFIAEDIEMVYSSINDYEKNKEQQKLWSDIFLETGGKLGVDFRIGRKLPALLMQHGFAIRFVKLAVVDTIHNHRQLLVDIFDLWRRMYATSWTNNNLDGEEYNKCFQSFIETVKDNQQYVCWAVPIIQATKKVVS